MALPQKSLSYQSSPPLAHWAATVSLAAALAFYGLVFVAATVLPLVIEAGARPEIRDVATMIVLTGTLLVYVGGLMTPLGVALALLAIRRTRRISGVAATALILHLSAIVGSGIDLWQSSGCVAPGHLEAMRWVATHNGPLAPTPRPAHTLARTPGTPTAAPASPAADPHASATVPAIGATGMPDAPKPPPNAMAVESHTRPD